MPPMRALGIESSNKHTHVLSHPPTARPWEAVLTRVFVKEVRRYATGQRCGRRPDVIRQASRHGHHGS